MENLLALVRASDSTITKALFLMGCGIVFVFLVQVVFYLIAKLWPRGKSAASVTTTAT